MTLSTESIPRMNVSKEADTQFLCELERTDPERYARLLKNMLKEVTRLRRLSEPGTVTTMQRRCQQCGLVLASDARADSRFCDDACRKASSRLRLAA
jgi:hypothetical protein